MPKVQAWQCPETGRLFPLDRTDRYRKHLRKVGRQRMLRRARKTAEEAFVARRDEFWRTTMSFTDIERFLVENTGEVFAQCREFNRRDNQGREREAPAIHRVTFQNMRWDEYLSNTHNAPVGRPTNYWQHENLPLSYPGWKGQILLEYRQRNKDPTQFDSTSLERWGVHLGSGGGGSSAHRYDVFIFEEEFINLRFSLSLMRPPK